MSDLHIAYISVGSNIGDKLANCQNGVALLAEKGQSRVLAQSRTYATEPVDYEDQDWFVNLMVNLETALDPLPLLDHIEYIQRAAGRIQHSPVTGRPPSGARKHRTSRFARGTSGRVQPTPPRGHPSPRTGSRSSSRPPVTANWI